MGTLLLLASKGFFLLIIVGYTALLLLWVSFLTVQRHYTLNVVLLCAFVFIGGGFLLCLSIEQPTIIAVLGVLFGVSSALMAYISIMNYKSTITAFLSREESQRNMKMRKSNFSKIFAEGLVFSVSAVLLMTSFEVLNIDPLYLGGIVVAAAVFSCFCRYVPNLSYENFMNWHMVLIYTALFVIYPVGDSILKIISSGLAFFTSICFILILLAAMSEFAKTIKVSCFYEFGREGSFFFMGVAAGLGVLWIVEHTLGISQPHLAETVICSALVISLVWLNIDIVKGGYPNPEEFGSAQERRIAPRHGISWKAKVNAVAASYGLSPRQQEVFMLLARGRNAAYIMNELCVSTATVKSHIYSVYRKLGIHTQQELIDMIEEYEISN